MSDSSNSPVEKPTSSENWFLRQWAENNKEGYTNYVMITANRLQKGKTTIAMRIGEVSEQYLGIPFPMEWDESKPTDFSGSNLGFDALWYMDRMDQVQELSILIGDEWNRAVGQRKWYTQENQDFAEILQTTAYKHIHGIFPLPHQALTDNAIVGICTSHIVVENKGFARVYSYDRDQLNRSLKQRTPYVGDLHFKKPSPKRWHTYLKMREAYTSARRRMLADRIRKAMEEAEAIQSAPRSEELIDLILANPDPYMGSKHQVSAIKIAAKHKIPWNRAMTIAVEVNAKRSESRN